ncbi:hypothetical protein HYW41_03715 [Candidatus Daviesbacteria bacterium]|nr:hypothetical protein [Candidatus Daviesbacteria bacterium]
MRPLTPVRLRIEKDVVIRIHRRLKGKGKFNISVGQEVIPSDIIGSAQVASGFRTLNLSHLLGVKPDEVEKYLKRPLGQRIYKDELLAFKSGGLLGGKKFVTSPTDGILDFLSSKTGELRMMFLPKKADLPAGVYGIVEKIDEEKGQAIIRTQVSIIHGVAGSGRIRDGRLHVISKRDELIGKYYIFPKQDEEILVGGSLIFKDALSAAISAGVNGVIIGGLNAKDYRGIAGGRLVFPKKLENDIGISVVVCEGFGAIPLGEDIYKLLLNYDGKFVSIDGNISKVFLPAFDSSVIRKVKNCKLPPLSEDATYIDERLDQFIDLKVNSKVRVVGNSYPGVQGKVVSLDQTETLLPSGIKAFLAIVETSKQKMKVPVANLEIMCGVDYSS